MAGETILVVGAGIAGLTLANALERRGLSPLVIEVGRTLQPAGLGLAIMPNGTRTLERLGLAAEIRKRSELIHRTMTLGPEGAELSAMDLGRFADRFGQTLAVQRTALLDGLTATLQAPTRLDTSVISLAPEGSKVKVEFTDGSTGTFDVVVGADGLHSRVRPLVFDRSDVVYRGIRAWRTLLPRRPDDPNDTVFRTAKGRHAGQFPVSAEWMYLFLLEHGPDDDPNLATGGIRQVRRVASHFGEAVQELADRADNSTPVLYTPVYEVIAESWIDERVCLIGDAAHAIVPFFAQGASMAIEDAAVLADCLARDAGPPGLEEYFERRSSRVAEVRNICRFRGMSLGMEGDIDAEQLIEHPGNVGDPLQRQLRLWAGIED